MSVSGDCYDDYLWGIQLETPGVQALLAKGLTRTPDAADLLRDIFLVFYKPRPELVNSPHVERLSDLQTRPIYHAFHPQAQLNIPESVLALGVVASHWFEQWESDEGGAQQPPSQETQAIDAEKLQDAQNLCSQESGVWQRMPWEEKQAIARRLAKQPKLARIAQLLGRVRQIPWPMPDRQMRPEHQEVYAITQGNQLDQLLPNELVNLSHPVRRKLFWRNYLEGQLFQYDLREESPLGRGPVICCIDNSGSMAGQAEVWSKAVALALLEWAEKQERPFVCIQFASPQELLKLELRQRATPQDRLAIAEHFFNGGTDFEAPLNAALDIMADADFRQGDIVFITDGEAPLSEDFWVYFQTQKAERHLRVISILIDYADHSDESVLSFSDQVIRASSLESDAFHTIRHLWEKLQQ